ncbi:hypothetical protein FO519_003139 [Halicephalobus sp. NKZ332]|nr:hypothetical protein FO519_003139 [Halicephalobus sp. NKZ332]
MGNSSSTSHPNPQFIRRNESFGSSSPRNIDKINNHHLNHQVAKEVHGSFGSSDKLSNEHDKIPKQLSLKKSSRSQSLEQKQSTQPKFQISGDLNPHQVNLVKRTWKQVLKTANDDENEMACRLLLRIFQLDHRNQVLFGLGDVPQAELRSNPLFVKHVKAIEPTLSNVMSHPTNATNLSKYLQQLGGRHVQYTGVTYKCSYWKTFVQALLDIVGVDKASGDTHDAFFILGSFCVEQMRIGYKIEYLLQREAERIALAQQKKRDALQQGYTVSGKKVT